MELQFQYMKKLLKVWIIKVRIIKIITGGIMKKILTLLMALFIGGNLFSAVTIENEIDGRKIEFNIEKTPERVVSLSQFSTEILLELGLKDKMVGTAFLEEPIYPRLEKDYNEVPILSEKWPSVEKLLSENPDFVTGWGVAFSKSGISVQTLINSNINVFIPKSTTEFNADMNTLFDDFRTIGKIFGIEEKTEDYINKNKEKIKTLEEKVKDLKEKKVFIYDSGTNEPFTVYEGFTTNLLSLVKLQNVMSGKGVNKTWGQVSWEEVVSEDPDYIIIVDYSTGNRDQADYDSKVEYLKNNPALKDLRAVKENAFIRVRLAGIVPGIRNVDTLEELAKEIYKEDVASDNEEAAKEIEVKEEINNKKTDKNLNRIYAVGIIIVIAGIILIVRKRKNNKDQ